MPNEVRITVSADDKASGPLRSIGGVASGLGKTMKSALMPAVAGAAVGFGVLGAGLLSSVKQAMESQKVQAQLGAVLKSTGGAAGVTAKMANDLASSLQRLTTYDDKAVLAAESLLLTFTNVGSKVFPDATKAILDMSTAMGQDLLTTTLQVGKALQSPVEGVTALQRVGVRLSEQQKQQVADFMAVGDAASAQNIILKELSAEFGGSAAAAADTFGGRMSQLKNALGEVQEAIGMALLPIIQELAEKLAAWLTTHRDQIQEVVDKWTAFATNEAFPAILQFLKDVKPLAQGWFDAFKLGMTDVIIPGLQWVLDNKAALVIAIGAIGLAMATAFGPYSAAVIGIGLLVAGLGLFSQAMKDAAAEREKHGETYWSSFAKDLASAAKSLGEILAGPAKGLFGFKQHGGIINTPFTVVGEKGPELIAGGQGSRVFSNDQSRQMLAGGGGQTINVNLTFTGPVLGDQHQANELMQWLMPSLRSLLA